MEQGHHVFSVKGCIVIFCGLLVLTVVTVCASYIDLGLLNFPIAMLIATIKASLVLAYFMGLKEDSNENRVIFFSSFIFVAIFIFLTYSDVLFRYDSEYHVENPNVKNQIQDIK